MSVEEIISLIYMIIFFTMGTLFGSFFSLATYRLPRKQDIVFKRSYCPKCNHELGFFDLIPVLSYVIRGGKCKYCGDKISSRYIHLEIFNGIFFLVNYILLGLTPTLIFVLFVYIIMFVFVGSSVMRNKMEFELDKNNNIVEVIKNRKKGVFNIELLVAVFAFIIYYVAVVYLTRNYNNVLDLYKYKSDAMNTAMNLIEESKALGYDNIQDKSGEFEIDSKKYVYTFNVDEYVEVLNDIDIYEYYENETYAKKLTAIVQYKYGSKTYECKLQNVMYKE